MGKAADSFNPDAYLCPPPDGRRECIAPTIDGDHCSNRPKKAEYDKACILRSALQDVSPEARRSEIKEMIRLRVCNNGHRTKLDAEQHCLNQLASRMEEAIFPDSFVPREDSIAPDVRDSTPLFSPYSDSCRLASSLTTPINRKQSGSGSLYSFSWPLAAEHKKIGWAKDDADTRIRTWGKCHPAASMQCRIFCPYPERMERLVHVQLADRRRQIIGCGHCKSTHIEWFRITQEEVLTIFRTWELIMEEHELYDTNGRLCDYWRKRIAGCSTTEAIMERMTSALDEELLSHTEHLLVQTSAACKDGNDEVDSSALQDLIADLKELEL